MKINIFLNLALSTFLITQGVFAEECKPEPRTPEERQKLIDLVENLYLNDPDIIKLGKEAADKKKNELLIENAKKAIQSLHRDLYEQPDDPVGGNPKGTVNMVVFMDPYCGVCRKFQTVLTKAKKNNRDLRIVYKPIAILGPESKKAAEEELAAQGMGRFEDYHEALYESSVKDRRNRFDLAERNNIDSKALREGILSNKVRDQLNNNMLLVEKLGITGAPAFIINDELHPGYADEDELDVLIKEARAAKGKKN